MNEKKREISWQRKDNYKKQKFDTNNQKISMNVEQEMLAFINNDKRIKLDDIFQHLRVQNRTIFDLQLKVDNLIFPTNALYYAACIGQSDRVKDLMQAAPDLEKIAYQSNTKVYPIQIAAVRGFVQTVLEILKFTESYFLPLTDLKQNILHLLAASNNKHHIVPILSLLNDADKLKDLINAQDNEGHTPLHIAIMQKHVNYNTVTDLIKFGAKKDVPLDQCANVIRFLVKKSSSNVNRQLIKLIQETEQCYTLKEQSQTLQQSEKPDSQEKHEQFDESAIENLLRAEKTKCEEKSLKQQMESLQMELFIRDKIIHNLNSEITRLKAKYEPNSISTQTLTQTTIKYKEILKIIQEHTTTEDIQYSSPTLQEKMSRQ